MQQRPFLRDRGRAIAPEMGYGMKKWQLASKWVKRHQYKDGRWLKLTGLPMELPYPPVLGSSPGPPLLRALTKDDGKVGRKMVPQLTIQACKRHLTNTWGR